MKYVQLGRTGLRVSRLCFGSLTIGPLQAKLPLTAGAEVITAALDAGVNFIDTAELYGTYPYIRRAIQGRADKVIIASKSYAYTYEGMRQSVEQACQEIGRDYIDIFMLHEQVSRLTLKGHADGMRYLLEAKERGLIKAVGVSTHMVDVVKAAAEMPEVDVIHPIVNIAGIGVCDGSAEDMLSAIQAAEKKGKGIYTMKALGGGHLARRSKEAIQWVLAQPGIHAVAVGMQCFEEVEFNCRLFKGQQLPQVLETQVMAREKRLLVEEWCAGCGACAAKCPMQAIRMEGGKAFVNEQCVLCGYCGAYCPDFCLKII